MRTQATFAEPRQEWVDATNEARAQAGVWVKNLMESLAYYDVLSRLPRIKASATLVMYGEHDRLREGEDLLYNNIVNSSKKILPGLGHIPQIEDPETFVDALLSFLQP
jgi:pimeloyl-ACP methyl ester carboxylesterase